MLGGFGYHGKQGGIADYHTRSNDGSTHTMKLPTWRSVLSRAQRLQHAWHPVSPLLCALVAAGVMSVGIATSPIQAGTVVRFDLNNPVDGIISYFDLELYDTEAPVTVANFVKYINNGLYDNSIIHRSADIQDINDYTNYVPFVIQGGGYSPIYEDGDFYDVLPIATYAPITNEFSSSRSNLRGTVAMAKLGDDADSATSQWFVNLDDNSTNLDNQNEGFTVFGKVIGDGMQIVDGIHDLETVDYGSPFDNFPVLADGSSPVVVTGASIISEPTGQLSGSVYVDMNKNGIMDGDDYAITDAKVSITFAGQDTPSATVYSGSDGSYNFIGLGSGTYSVKMESSSTLLGQDNGAGQIVVDKDGNILSVGSAGTAQVNAYNDVWLGDAQSGTNFNFVQETYPVSLVSARLLLNSSTGIPRVDSIAIPDTVTNTDDSSVLEIVNVLVGKQGSANLTFSNLGSAGSKLEGVFTGASDEFGSADDSPYGPLDAGDSASREYTFTPTVRGTITQDVSVTSDVGNTIVTLSGKGVAPVSSVPSSVTAYTLVGRDGVASVTIQNIGDGNLSGLGDESNLIGSINAFTGDFTGDSESFSLKDGESKTFDFITFAPTDRDDVRSAEITADFLNGNSITDGDSVSGDNSAHTLDNITVTCQGVAPISSFTQQSAGYVLVKKTGTASVTIQNLGDGNLSELGDESNLKGVLNGSTGTFVGDGGDINLEDGGASEAFEYTFTPTVRGETTTTLTADFTNGHSDGTNAPHSLNNIEITGIGVAPLLEVKTDFVDAGYVRIGSTGTSAITLNNIGDGNLSGLPYEESNLIGTITAGTGSFSGDGSDISMYDNDSQAFHFTYAPTVRGEESAAITLDFINGSDDGMNNAQTVNIDITGCGVRPEFSSDIAPDSILDFGLVPEADTKSLFLEVSNITTDLDGGDRTLIAMTLISVGITGTDAELFSVEDFTPGTVLNAGDLLSLEIFYNGTGDHGDHLAVLTILTDEGTAYGFDGNSFTYQIQAQLAPEPGSLVLLAIAGLVIGGMTWRRRTSKKD